MGGPLQTYADELPIDYLRNFLQVLFALVFVVVLQTYVDKLLSAEFRRDFVVSKPFQFRPIFSLGESRYLDGIEESYICRPYGTEEFALTGPRVIQEWRISPQPLSLSDDVMVMTDTAMLL